ncbi:MAG: hypothetical protein AB7U40_03610 [Methanobacteriales archaeon]
MEIGGSSRFLFSEEIIPYDEPINIQELKVFRFVKNELRLFP